MNECYWLCEDEDGQRTLWRGIRPPVVTNGKWNAAITGGQTLVASGSDDCSSKVREVLASPYGMRVNELAVTRDGAE